MTEAALNELRERLEQIRLSLRRAMDDALKDGIAPASVMYPLHTAASDIDSAIDRIGQELKHQHN